MSRTLTARRLSAVVAPLLLAASLTACGGDDGDGAPEAASKEDFCEVYNDDGDDEAFNGEGSSAEQAEKIVAALQEATDKLAEVGTPKDIPDDARAGFEVFVDEIAALDEDEVEKAIDDENGEFLQDSIDEDDQKKVEAFTTWAGKYCA